MLLRLPISSSYASPMEFVWTMWTTFHKSLRQQQNQARIFSGNFSTNWEQLISTTYCLASRVLSRGLFSNRAAVQTMTKREDLRKEFLAIAELRLMKVEEIRELLSISPAASVEEVLRIMKCWQDSGESSTPAELKSQAHRLLSEIHCLNGAGLEILDKLRPVAPATASILSYKYERTQ